jgi:hypothetical protein
MSFQKVANYNGRILAEINAVGEMKNGGGCEGPEGAR